MKFLNKNTLIGVLIGLIGICIVFGFTPARKHDKAGRSGDLSNLEPELAKFFKEDFEIFEEKTKASPSDWLASHKEKGQTFGEYLRSGANIPSGKRKILYVLPLGEFGESAPSLEELQTYMESYYMPLKVKILESVADRDVKAKSRKNRGARQWKSPDILKWMKASLPNDAYAMIAVTMTDLYPDEKWNFVFGQASFKERVGVFSFARYHDQDENVTLLRAAKVLTHEMGHMFGIKHCTFFQCIMNGANHLQEMDNTPPNLCPVCLRKLHHATSLDPTKRYNALNNFYQKHGMKDQVDWILKRLEN